MVNLLSVFLGVLIGTADAYPSSTGKPQGESKMQSQELKANQITIRVGKSNFAMTVADSETARRFRELLPLTIEMPDLNGNEKHCDLPKSLPTQASNPKYIEVGDIMLYGSKTLVIFYKSFPTSYSYTRLGKVDDPRGLENAFGSGTVTLTLGDE